MKFSWIALSLLVAVETASAANQVFYTDSLSSDVQNWSWGGSNGTPNFSATDLVYEGSDSIYYESTSGAYGGLSLYTSTTFGNTYNALYFAVSGDDVGNKIDIHFSATSDSADIGISLSSCINSVVTSATSWTVAQCDISNLAVHEFNRITFQDKAGVGIAFHLDSIYLGFLPPKYPTYTGVSVLGSQTIVLYGTGTTANITEINFYKSGSSKKQILKFKNVKSVADVSFQRTYVDVSTPFVPGNLTVVTTSANFSVSIGDTILNGNGMAFISDANFAKKYGITLNRWGGNDRSNYNPAIDASNSGNDWYYINKPVSNAQKFISDTLTWGKAFYSLAALDWISKNNDTQTASFPKSIYPDQQKFWNDLGNGVYSNGTNIPSPDPSSVYTPWNTTLAESFLRTLNPVPSMFAIDNELDITGSTHRDCHPVKMTYDELLNDRFLPYAKVIKKVFPKSFVVGPSSCCWYFYWNSDSGSADKAAHNGTDFLPWFLKSLKSLESKTGRLLDSLDIHAYAGDGLGTGIGTDDKSAAQRLRLSRAYWDPTYVDEGWFGTNTVTNQPSPNTAMYIPRFRKLIADNYPGTKFGIGEWNFGGETHISGGLVVADALGVFGREKLDWATYWYNPADGSYAAAGFWLYRGNSSYPFPSFANQLTFDTAIDPNYFGIYAATTKANGYGKPAVVIINKHFTNSILLKINDKNNAFNDGTFHVRHFGGVGGSGLGSSEIKIVDGVIVVPALSTL
ncbi:hypothetical protein HK096_004300, partial [Nowakowskiella sp. JEL0078]